MSDLTRYRRVCGFGHDDDCHSVYKEDDTLQQIADYMAKWREDTCYSDDDCVIGGQSVDMTEFWTGWDGLVVSVTEGELCGAWGGCRLPKGHNRGKVDIPANHRPVEPT